MGQCINCGSQTVFDIKTQQLACVSCGSAFPVPKDNVDSDGGFAINTFSCPQCGASLNTTDTSMAEFCSYCGASVVLTGRSNRCARPKMVAPFKVTKDNVREAFKRQISKVAFLAPEFKDDRSIESMRGIYIPYWSYKVGRTGVVAGEYSTRSYSGDDEIVRDYRINFDVMGSYNGVLFDASNAFADDLSEDLKPFSIKEAVPFQSGYLSGFYADSPDVAYNEYLTSAQQTGKDFLKNDLESQCHEILTNVTGTLDVQAVSSVMMPVWFLTYRRNNRVAYMVANGQTGKIAADLPVDYKKAFMTAGLISLIAYLLLMFIPALHAKFLLTLCDFMMFPLGYMYLWQVRHIDPAKHVEWNGGVSTPFAIASSFSGIISVQLLAESASISGRGGGGLIAFESVVVMINVLMAMFTARKRRGSGRDTPFYLLLMSVPILSALVGIINPVSDMAYYAFAFLVCGIVLFCLVVMIKGYEELATRKLPHFDRRGGDNRAY